ncbi:MAG TPA: NADPH-dependent F420 reductase [Chloroflexia bacterium]|nr:NADPH-dependent F420 reductase [Chloroflexia bacterium]
MKVGIIGTGVVGQTLGTGLVNLGHTVKIGSRDASNPKLQEWVSANGERASGGTFAEAAEFGEVLIVATHYEGTENALKLAGPDNFAGKVVIDATNPLSFGADGPSLAVGFSDSAAEQIQRLLPGARVVKAFNIVPAALMIQPDLLGELPDMFICGNDQEAKQVVTDILTAFGWPPAIDLGGLQEARLVEPLGMVWIKYYFNTKNWQHAFKLIRK